MIEVYHTIALNTWVSNYEDYAPSYIYVLQTPIVYKLFKEYTHSNPNIIVYQVQPHDVMTAKEIRAYRTLSARLIKLEEQGNLIGNLIARGVGFKEEEDFVIHEHSKFRSSSKYQGKKETSWG